VGEGIFDLVDPETLEAELEAAEQEVRELYEGLEGSGLVDPVSDPRYGSSTAVYRCWDDARRRRVPLARAGARCGHGQGTAASSASDLDGHEASWHVIRRRWRR
jgi:hypothetical protein